MDESLFLCLFLCLLATVRGTTDVLCEHGYCRGYMLDVGCTTPASDCTSSNVNHTGMWLPSPTICNCCEFCLPFYGDGEYCSRGGPGTGFTVGRCGDGLTCVVDPNDGHSFCERMNSTCHNKQDSFDERLETGQAYAMEQRPRCDGKGKFDVVDCVPAHTCFCQSEEGARIFGEVLHLGTVTTQNMHCGCSRLHAKIASNISPGLPLPVVGPRCTSDGNFNPVQCLNRTCHCVDKITGEILEGEGRVVDLDEHPITELACYDRTLDLFPQQSMGDPPYNYTTPCFEGMQERLNFIKQSEEDGFIMDYFSTVPQCMPDGTYGRVVRRNTGVTVCVDERGRQIKDYVVQSNTTEAITMNCNCAQTSLVMNSSIEKPVCCQNGNFRTIQCRRGLCRCVDADGRQTERESADVTTLSCWTPEWRTC